jgi:hypothetical protein
MSDHDTGSAGANGTTAASPAFTEREMQMLGWAMQSLKTGPPEVRPLPFTTHPVPPNPLRSTTRSSLASQACPTRAPPATPGPRSRPNSRRPTPMAPLRPRRPRKPPQPARRRLSPPLLRRVKMASRLRLRRRQGSVLLRNKTSRAKTRLPRRRVVRPRSP